HKRTTLNFYYENLSQASQAEIEIPENISDFIFQQKRDLNEYFFVSFYATTRLYNIWTSGHSII
ncbi:494_t:CDS:1, partial [Dentiscutata heterogama]